MDCTRRDEENNIRVRVKVGRRDGGDHVRVAVRNPTGAKTCGVERAIARKRGRERRESKDSGDGGTEHFLKQRVVCVE